MTSNKSNRATWLEGPSATCLPPAEVAHPWRLILLGAPGVGKGTQADLLRQRLGALVPDTTVWEMVRERTACLRCRGGFILDGFPRTLVQAESLKKLMEDERLSLEAVVNYELPLGEIVERLSGRRTCEKCKAVYHVSRQPSQTSGVCDRCGGRLFQHEDDRPEAVTVRMEAYQRSTAPLIEFYRKLGVLLPIAATGSPDEICTRTIASLQQAAPVRAG